MIYDFNQNVIFRPIREHQDNLIASFSRINESIQPNNINFQNLNPYIGLKLHQSVLNQIKSLLLLRSKQCYRYLKEIGFGVIIVALFILTGVIATALQKVLATPATGAIILSLVLLVSIEIKREDTHFLKSIFGSKQQLIKYKIIENVLIIFPVLIFQGIFFRWDIILCIIVICGGIAFIPLNLLKSQSKERKRSIPFIPLSLFEIKFYVEKKLWTFVFVWILLFLGGLHISLWVLGMFVLCTFPIDIYTPTESREMVNYTPHFVFNKIKEGLRFFLLFATLPTLIILVFTDINIFILVYGVSALILSLILSISKKYVSYYGVNESIPSTTSTMILVFIMLAPGGILITLSACIYYYIQAENHMKRIYAIL